MRCPQSVRFWFQPPVGAPLPQSFVLLLVRPQKMHENAVFRIQGISSWSDGIWSFQSRPNQVRTFQNMLMAQWQFSRVAFRNCGADPLSYTINSISRFFRCQMLPTFLYSFSIWVKIVNLPKTIKIHGLKTENNRIRLTPWHHNSNNPLLGANLQWSLAISY